LAHSGDPFTRPGTGVSPLRISDGVDGCGCHRRASGSRLTPGNGRHLLPAVRDWVHGVFSMLPVFLLGGCGVWPGSSGGNGWKAAVEVQTAQLGYGNWIVIAESSFPAHSRPGTRQVNSYQPIPVVLDEVFRCLERTEHVRPKIFIPRELGAVENDFAPGVDSYRAELKSALHAYEATELDQDSLITLVQDAQRSFDVLVIRTTTALPYSCVFMELQPGYWDGESEQRLRERMSRQQREKLATPRP